MGFNIKHFTDWLSSLIISSWPEKGVFQLMLNWWRILTRGKGKRALQAKGTVSALVGRQDIILHIEQIANSLGGLVHRVWVVLWWDTKLEMCFGTRFWKALNARLWSWILFIGQEDFWWWKWLDSCIRKRIHKIIKIILVYRILICVQSSWVYIAFPPILKTISLAEWSR